MAWLRALLQTFEVSNLFEVFKQCEPKRVGLKRGPRTAKKKLKKTEILQKLGIELGYKALSIYLIVSSFRIIFVENVLFTVN